MGIGGALRQLGEFLEECERVEALEAVDLVECNESPGEGLSADVELALARPPFEEGSMELCATSVNADGTVRLGFETAKPVVPAADHDVGIEPREARLSSGGEVRVVLSASVASEEDSTGAAAETADGSGGSSDDTSVQGYGRDRDVPPFKDPDLLASVYESCDTFAEMAEALEMDVTAETVRRYMIDYDIHEPNSYDTVDSEDGASGPGDDEPVVLSDGIGLPEDITVDALIGTVKQSNTIYEVKRDMGVDREDALEMLRELNLLDLVVGRLATEAERDISREDVVERLREASATRAG
jgi:hypothetical protein